MAAVRVCPSLSRPVIDGSSLLLGSSAPIRPVAADVASVEPPALVAVTTTRTVEPTRRGDEAERGARRSGDFFAGFAFAVALQPLVGVADGFGARPAADRRAEELPVFEQAADARRPGVGWDDGADEARCGGGGRRGAEPVRRGDLDLEGVRDVERTRFVGGAGGTGDRGAFAGQRRAADPLIAVRERRRPGPFAGCGGERLAVDRETRDRGGADVHRRAGDDLLRRFGGGACAAHGVGGGDDDAQLASDLRRGGAVARPGGAGDRRADPPGAGLPLVGEGQRRRALPGSAPGGQQGAVTGDSGDGGRLAAGRWRGCDDGRRGGGRAGAAFTARGGDDHAEPVPHVERRRAIGVKRGPVDRAAPAARVVAPRPFVGVGGGFGSPLALGCLQHAAVARGSADRRRGHVVGAGIGTGAEHGTGEEKHRCQRREQRGGVPRAPGAAPALRLGCALPRLVVAVRGPMRALPVVMHGASPPGRPSRTASPFQARAPWALQTPCQSQRDTRNPEKYASPPKEIFSRPRCPAGRYRLKLAPAGAEEELSRWLQRRQTKVGKSDGEGWRVRSCSPSSCSCSSPARRARARP